MVELLRDEAKLVRIVAVERLEGDRYHAALCWFDAYIYQEWLSLTDGRWLQVPTGCNNVNSSITLVDVDLTITSTPKLL